MRTRRECKGCVPAPREGVDAAGLPHALTFFVSAEDRRAVLAKLRRIEKDRARALLRALKIDITG